MSRELPFPPAAGDYPPSCEDSVDSKGAAATYLHASTDPPPATDPSAAVQSKSADSPPIEVCELEAGKVWTCQKCGGESIVRRRVGGTAWKSSLCLLCACPLLFPVSCLPLCLKSFRNVEHYCRTCNELIRTPAAPPSEAFSPDPSRYRAE